MDLATEKQIKDQLPESIVSALHQFYPAEGSYHYGKEAAEEIFATTYNFNAFNP